MSSEQSQYIWCKTIPHIEVGLPETIEVSKILILTVRDFLSISGGCPLLVDHTNNAFQNNSLFVVAKMRKELDRLTRHWNTSWRRIEMLLGSRFMDEFRQWKSLKLNQYRVRPSCCRIWAACRNLKLGSLSLMFAAWKSRQKSFIPLVDPYSFKW